MIGKTLGKYRIVEQIGRGGMAKVYKAYQPGLDRYVAIKLMHASLAEEEGFLERFRREAQSAGRLSHPNIVHMYDFDVEDNVYYIVMELLEGPSLKERLAELATQGEWPPLEEALRIICDVGEALDYAHRHGMFHRDIKPANIMLTESRGAILTDFGIVKMLGDATRLTASGVVIGTPAYMAPEQSLGAADDARVDVYSLGIVLYQLVTGRLPYDADTPMAIILKHVSAPLPIPRMLNPDLPEGIERVILKSLAKDPNDRYQSMREMLDQLDRATMGLTIPEVDPAITTASQPIAGLPTLTGADLSPAAPATRTAPPARRGAWWAWGLIGLTLAAIIIALAAMWVGRGDEATPAPTVAPPTITFTPTPSPSPTDTPRPTHTPDQTATSRAAALDALVRTASAPPPTPTRTATLTPTQPPTSTPPPQTPTVTATPQAFAVVLAGGADLRPGASTWWHVRQTLPAGTELELLGHDPHFSDWVYVRTLDGASSGWTQVAQLDTLRELSTLPIVTTVPTLTPATEVAPTVTPPAVTCDGGPLRLDAWPVDRVCTASGWTATIFVEGHGGDCMYTYSWEGEIQGGPMPGSMTFGVHSAGFGNTVVGRAAVTSAGERVEREVYVEAPDCP